MVFSYCKTPSIWIANQHQIDPLTTIIWIYQFVEFFLLYHLNEGGGPYRSIFDKNIHATHI